MDYWSLNPIEEQINVDLLVLCERKVHTIREKLANGGIFLNQRQCLDLSLKLSETIQNVREHVSHCGGLYAANFRPDLENLYRIVAQAEVLMEFMEEDLFSLMNRWRDFEKDEVPFPILDAVDVMRQIGEAVNYLHTRSIVHRDLKSPSILVKLLNCRAHEPVNVVDFGISEPKNLDVDALPVLNSQKDPQNDGDHNFSDVYTLCKSGKDNRWSIRRDLSSKIRSFLTLDLGPSTILRGQAPNISDGNGAFAKDLVGPANTAAEFKKSKSIQMRISDYQRTDFNLEEEIQHFDLDLQTSRLGAPGRTGRRGRSSQGHKLQRSVDLLSQATISIPESELKLKHESQLKLLHWVKSAILEDVDMSSGGVGVHDLHRELLAKAESERQNMELERSQMVRSILNHDEPARKRISTRHWSAEEVLAMLELTQEAIRMDVRPYIWDYVSENLLKQYGFDRASISCQQRWDTLLKSFNAIREHKSKIQRGTSSCVSYWKMNEDERSKNKLLEAFHLEWYEMIERILTAKSFDEKTSGTHTEADLPSSDLPHCQSQLDAGHLGSADCDEVLYDELMDSEVEDTNTESEDEEVSGDSTTTIESQAGVPVGDHVPQTKQTLESEYETNSKYAGRKRSATTVMEDDLIAIIAPIVNQQIEDALKPLLSALRSREELEGHRYSGLDSDSDVPEDSDESDVPDEQKHREKLLATEAQKLLKAIRDHKSKMTKIHTIGMAGLDEPFSLRAFSRKRHLESNLLNVWVTSNATSLAQGHETNGVKQKKPAPCHMQAAKRTAPAGGEPTQDKRFRGAFWEDDEKTSLLVGKLRFFVICMLQNFGLSTFKYGKSWSHYVSEQLGRPAKSCQCQWDSLLKSRNAIRDHESKIKSGTISHVSFWQMDEYQKNIVNEERRSTKLEPLPRVFQRAWYELMEMIDGVKNNPGFKKVADANHPSSSTAPHIASTITSSDNSPVLGPSDFIRSQPSSSYDRDSMGPPLPLVSTQLGSQRAEDEVLGMSDDLLISMIAPFITKRHGDDLKTTVMPLVRSQEENEQKLLAIEEKLDLQRKEMLTPLIPFWRNREDEEQKHKEKLLAMEEEKLAPKREKMQFTDCILANSNVLAASNQG